MAEQSGKTLGGVVDGTPLKRLFYSIISDYDLKTGLCELVDNALDMWVTEGQQAGLEIKVNLNVQRQIIEVQDNAGGVAVADLKLLVAPGGSRNHINAALIGIFGVGSKRAAVALGETVEIRTRYRRKQTALLSIDRDWINAGNWDLNYHIVSPIAPGTTKIEITRLRNNFDDDDVQIISEHLRETYSWYIRKGISIELNGRKLKSRGFEKWAYPPDQAPRRVRIQLHMEDEQHDEHVVEATITAGLITDRVAEAENYGVYTFCNNRLIAKEVKTREVGYYVTSEAGVPHPDASLCRAIVRLNGPAKLMPWNSSKNAISYSHPTFVQIRPHLIRLVSHFSSLSRRLKGDWDQHVFRYSSGQVEEITTEEITAKGRLILPSLPRVNRSIDEQLKEKNRKLINDKPWTLGLLESMSALHVMKKQKLETRNRIALLLLDSSFEIALKEYLVHDPRFLPPQMGTTTLEGILKNRIAVIDKVRTAAPSIDGKLWDRAAHYGNLRNKLIHEKATVDILDSDIDNYSQVVRKILRELFGLRLNISSS